MKELILPTIKRFSIGRARIVILFLFLLVNIDCNSNENVFSLFVSPIGNDTNDGTYEKPLATLVEARNRIRKARKTNSNIDVPVEINLRKGKYYLDNSFVLDKIDSGTKNSPLIIKAYGNEYVTISGAINISTNSFDTVDINQINRLPPLAREHVKMINLKSHGIMSISKFHLNKTRSDIPATEELFVNGKPMQLARWPNSGWVSTGKIADRIKGIKREYAVEFLFDNEKLNKWQGEPIWAHGYWYWDWSDEAIEVKSVDITKRSITLKKPHRYGIKENARYYVINSLSELDTPGEYYIDREKLILYLWPPGILKKEMLFELSFLEDAIIDMNNVSNVVIEGIEIQSGRTYGIRIRSGHNIVVNKCSINNIGNMGIKIKGGKNHIIKNSKIDNVNSGIGVIGGDRATLTKSGHKIVNNLIQNFGRRLHTEQPAIALTGVGHLVRNNLIRYGPHMAIRILGNDHTIEYNEIHNVCSQTSDAGAVYTGRDWTSRGTAIRYNYIHDIKGMNGKGDVMDIYLDDMASGITIEGNILSSSHRCLLVGGGRDNRVENNVFFNCKIPFSVDARGLIKRSKFLKINIGNFQRLGLLTKDNLIWNKHYPRLDDLLDDDPLKPKYNVIINNILIKTGIAHINPIAKWYGRIDKNWVTNRNPGFKSPEAGDFSMERDTVIDNQRINWKKIPFGEIGLRKEKLNKFNAGASLIKSQELR